MSKEPESRSAAAPPQASPHGIQPEDELTFFQHELEVHREELLAQFEQLKRTQALLEASRNEFAELYDFAPIAYLTLDAAGVVLGINLTGCGLLEVERGRILGMPLITFVDEAHRGPFLDHMRRCRQERGRIASDLVLKTRSGRRVPALLVSQGAGTPEYRTVAFDRTEQAHAERAIRELNAGLEQRVLDRTAELEQANARLQQEVAQREQAEAALQEAHRRKDEFLAMLGHELRNPLGPIRNAASIMRIVSSDRPELREMGEIIERQVQHMSRIVDDLLDVTRISRGKIGLLREPINFTRLVRDAIADFRPTLVEGGLTLDTSFPDDDLWVEGDPVRLTQVLGNLLQNAQKFTDPGGRVTVRLTRLPALNEGLLTIEDTGIGLEPEMLERLFDPFSQADRSLDRARGGLGLGLALVHGLVDLHGGSIDAASAGAGRGSKFSIRLPLIAAPESKDGTEDDPPTEASHCMRVLIIDDQRDTVHTMERLLAKLGHEVITALNGEEGVRLARELQPQVVFSDIGLPGMTGYDVAQAIRADRESKPPFLVAVTGYGQGDDMRRALQAGFDRHLVKPVDFNEIQRLLLTIAP